jgi:acyl-CoA oxidase
VESALADLHAYKLIPNSLSSSTLKSSKEDVRIEDPARGLREAISVICMEILPEAIGLGDAFGFTDWELDRCAQALFLPFTAFFDV